MTYTIAQAAKRSGLTAHTLRYYDKQGLLPFVDRDSSGNRSFKESDFEWLSIINCFKKTGMSLKEVKQYIDWCQMGDSSLNVRLEAMKKRKEAVLAEMAELERYMETINHKIEYYETAVEAGTESVHYQKKASGV